MNRVGLCAECAHARSISSRRGSHFILCGRAASQPEFERYPRLPVRVCAGFEVDEKRKPAAAKDEEDG